MLQSHSAASKDYWIGGHLENISGAYHAPSVASLVAAVVALGACLAPPVMAGDESPQAVIRAFELRIVQRRVPQAQRVLRAADCRDRVDEVA